MYELSTLLIVGILFVLILAANEIGLKIGEYYESLSDDDIKSQTTSIQGGIIGLLALILGFSFNMALQRYDTRAAAEIAEANSIGTAILRTKLLPDSFVPEARQLLRQYIDLRLTIADVDLTEQATRRQYNQQIGTLQDRLWQLGIAAAEVDPRPITTGYFVQSLNDMIDAQGKRNDQLQRHIPPVIFYLLFVVFIATSGLIGYSSGIGRRTSRVPAMVLSALIVLLVFIIIDLDRPKRGMIEVRQDSMQALEVE